MSECKVYYHGEHGYGSAMVQSRGVVRLLKFLCGDSIAAVLKVHAAYRVPRASPVTTYLSADDLFRWTEPALFERLRSLRGSAPRSRVRAQLGSAARGTADALDRARAAVAALHRAAHGRAGRKQPRESDALRLELGRHSVGVLIDDAFAGGEFETPSCSAASSSLAAAVGDDSGRSASRAAPSQRRFGLSSAARSSSRATSATRCAP